MNLAHTIEHNPDFSLLTVELQAGQQVFSEPGAMAWMDPNIKLKAGMKGGLGATFGKMLGGESVIVSTYTAEGAPGKVAFAPGGTGSVAHVQLDGSRKMLVQRGGYLAHSGEVNLTGKWQGLWRGFVGGEGLVMLQASGKGDLWFTTYGALLPVDVSGEYYVDNGYIVAFEDTLDYEVTTMPSLRPGTGSKIKSFFLGGEGMVTRFSGQGRLWIQTRQVGAFLGWAYPFRPTKNNN